LAKYGLKKVWISP